MAYNRIKETLITFDLFHVKAQLQNDMHSYYK